MAEFPEDVIIAAREAAAKAWAADGEYLQREFRSGMRDDSGSVQSAAEAIMAERQRCANVAESCDVETKTLNSFEVQVRMARRDIKAAIVLGMLPADPRKEVIVVCENDYPKAVFSSTENATAWTESLKDATSPFASRIHRHHHSFVVDAEVDTTTD